MAASERAFWAAAAGINPAGLSTQDVKLRALRQATGLSTKSLADCERKFYADRLAVSPLGKSLTDLEKQYYKSLGIASGSVIDMERAFIKGTLSGTWAWTP